MPSQTPATPPNNGRSTAATTPAAANTTGEGLAAQWEAERQALAQAALAAGAAPGIALHEQVAGLSGLQVMQAMLAGKLPYPHIGQTLDFGLIEVAHGRAVFQGTPQLAHYNPLGTVHGGWFATLLDSALGCAVHTTMQPGYAYTTAELSVNLVRAATEKTGPLRAIGQVVHSGRQLATAEARLVDANGKLYAHGTTTCLVFEKRAPRA